MELKTEEFEKAILSLESALKQPKNEFIRDAAIQRFEFTFVLGWKLSKKALNHIGIESLSPRSVIRDMGQQKWIDDPEKWMKFLDHRNLTSHTYNEKTAEKVYEVSKEFLPECKKLLSALHHLKKTS
jgi:nucleotidyltransferase substrate binding protein (TIGR01987 family)